MEKSNSTKRKNRGKIFRIMMFLGFILIVLSICIFVGWHISINKNAENLKEYISMISSVMPEKQNVVLEEKSDKSMPVFSAKGKDFIGLIEFVANGRKFPICADFDNIEAYPCRKKGSIYDASIIIGATDFSGQIDFIDKIFVSDKITFTDMLGDCYSYKVVDIRYSDNANLEHLNKKDYDLTLFIKKTYSSEYVIISCMAAGTV